MYYFDDPGRGSKTFGVVYLFIFVVRHGKCDVIYANNVKLMLSSRGHSSRNVNNTRLSSLRKSINKSIKIP